ncbi:MAG: hypothetical protein WB755_27515 [Terriglobales bacterium]
MLQNYDLARINGVMQNCRRKRGLVVNMSGVLFDTGKHTLRPLAREKLAKISGIVLAYPALTGNRGQHRQRWQRCL